MVFSIGLTIGKYELGRKLGEGGFGFVFVGRDLSLDREVELEQLVTKTGSSMLPGFGSFGVVRD